MKIIQIAWHSMDLVTYNEPSSHNKYDVLKLSWTLFQDPHCQMVHGILCTETTWGKTSSMKWLSGLVSILNDTSFQYPHWLMVQDNFCTGQPLRKDHQHEVTFSSARLLVSTLRWQKTCHKHQYLYLPEM